MIISGKQTQNIIQLYKEQNLTAKTNKQNKTTAVGQDEVILSSEAQEFSQIYQNLKALPEVRQEKVQELQTQIEGGTYQVSAEDIAAKMLEKIGTDQL